MATIRRHMSVNIQGFLNNFKRKKLDYMIEKEDKTLMTDQEARIYLNECLDKGWKLLPTGECEGFDHFGGGCPGHKVE